MRTTAAIVGDGLAGLHAARLLHAAGIDFRLLEARDRLGGRILLLDGSGALSDDGLDLGPSWFWPGMQPGLAAQAHGLGLAAFLQHGDGNALFERTPEGAIHRFPSMRQEPRSMRLAGGTGALVKALAAALPSERLRLGSAVSHVALRRDGVVLSIGGPVAARHVLTAEQVVLALPPGLLATTVGFDPSLEPNTASL